MQTTRTEKSCKATLSWLYYGAMSEGITTTEPLGEAYPGRQSRIGGWLPLFFLVALLAAVSMPLAGLSVPSSLDASEAVLAELEEKLLAFERDLVKPDGSGRALEQPELLFVERPRVSPGPSDLIRQPLAGPEALGLEAWRWRVEGRPVEIDRATFRPWHVALGELESVESVRVFVIDGSFSANQDQGHAEERFGSRHVMTVKGRTGPGGVAHLSGEFELDWLRGEDGWRIREWRDQRLTGTFAVATLFEDATEKALPGSLSNQLRRSPHEEEVQRYLTSPESFRPPHPQFQAVSHDRHPAVSVVDIDRDGWDDLYVTSRLGRNRLLRNLGNGTFEDSSVAYGLDFEGSSSCALFLDFDQDGDLDLFLCRTLERSRLLIQQDGRFVDVSERSPEPLPMHVASASVADYDGDGRLDIYVSTYNKTTTRGLGLEGMLSADPSSPMPSASALAEMAADERVWTNVWGPANLLLRNMGDASFERAGLKAGAQLFRQTFQASWSDYDLDGDPDLYLANDYAPNNLLRNRGDGTFEDVTEPSHTSDRGFGMGASWGDYDRDGRPDLYVSNMFSKAGKRVVRKMLGEDSQLAEMARGNSLFRNGPGDFERASARDGFEVVERTGWSWGGQFVDVDNDGWLDVAVLNGYYTVPAHLRKLPVDT